MTPSENQHGSDSDYNNVFERAFAGHMDSAMPLITGIGSEEAALKAHRAAHEYDASKAEKEAIAEKLKQYR